MFLPPWRGVLLSRRFPRARGDVPIIISESRQIVRFSPRTRGCSFTWDAGAAGRAGFPRARGDVPQSPSRKERLSYVFPAHAGMFRACMRSESVLGRFPRARGDVPPRTNAVRKSSEFSPRTRGCSFVAGERASILTVFPAHAGMFRVRQDVSNHTSSFPRARGDVPAISFSSSASQAFSPRTRGCSPPAISTCKASPVFPAHAGMFRPGASQ